VLKRRSVPPTAITQQVYFNSLLADQPLQLGDLSFLGVGVAVTLERVLGLLRVQLLPLVHLTTEPAPRG